MIKRSVLSEIYQNIDNSDIILLIGARQVGKTTILKEVQEFLRVNNKKSYFLNLEDPEIRKSLDESPKNLFKIVEVASEDRTYVFVDEVQYLKDPSNFLKYIRDEYENSIKLLVSGSSAFYLDEKFHDSLAGRKKIFFVRTLSFEEFLNFKNIDTTQKDAITKIYGEYMIFGGYPKVVLAETPEKKRDALEELAYSYIKKDIGEAGIRQEEIFYQLFKILSASVGNLVNASELASVLGVSKTIIDRYLHIMQKSFHVKLVRPFYRNIRKELSRMPKVFFYDLGLRNFFTGNFQDYEKRADCGMLLENACFRRLVDKENEEEIRFWRTTGGQELDFVVNERRTIEVKANALQARDRHYKAFAKKYPETSFEVATINKKIDKIRHYPVREVWEL